MTMEFFREAMGTMNEPSIRGKIQPVVCSLHSISLRYAISLICSFFFLFLAPRQNCCSFTFFFYCKQSWNWSISKEKKSDIAKNDMIQSMTYDL